MVPSEELAPFEKKRFIPYVYLGFGPQFILQANFDQLTRSIDETLQSESDLAVSRPRDISVIDQRNRWNYAINGGIGTLIKVGRDYFQFDIRYNNTLRRINKGGDTRLSNSELIYLYGYVDDDFRLSHIQFSLGYTLRHFDPLKEK